MTPGKAYPERARRLAQKWIEARGEGMKIRDFCRDMGCAPSWLWRAVKRMEESDRKALEAEGVRVVGDGADPDIGEGWGV